MDSQIKIGDYLMHKTTKEVYKVMSMREVFSDGFLTYMTLRSLKSNKTKEWPLLFQDRYIHIKKEYQPIIGVLYATDK